MSPTHPSSPLTPARVEVWLRVLNWTTQRLGLQVAPIVEIEQLRSLPPGSFGRAWADHLDERGLHPLQGPRRQQLHDGIHVLTGYDTDLIGEAEVQAFLLGAKFRMAHGVLLAELLRVIARQRRSHLLSLPRAQVRSRLWAAYQRGQRAPFDPDTWQPEQLWRLPLHEVRSQVLTPPE